MKRIEDYLLRHAVNSGTKVAVVCGDEELTYRQLYDLVTERVALLRKKRSNAVIVKTSQTIDFILTYFAAHLANVPIVPLEKDVTDANVIEIEHIINDCAIPDDVADVLFTTGSTGSPKGVMITHEAILANAENLIDAQGFTSNHTFIISGPLNHIGSLSKVWPIIVVGGTLIITGGMKDLESFFKALDYPCTKMATFLVPASLRMLTLFAKERLHDYTHKLDFIETGAAPMSQSDMEQLCSILPNTRLYNTYASTETGIISTHDYQHDGCIAGCLGSAMKHSEIIIQTNGRIACKGKTLMKGYIGNLDLTNKILYDGVLYTSDLGHIDEQGRLRLEGRVDDMINVGGFKVSPIEIESIAMKYKGIADCICIGITHPLLGNALKLIYSVKNGEQVSRQLLIAYLKQNIESNKLPYLYEQSEKIQRTFNGKLDRMFYKER